MFLHCNIVLYSNLKSSIQVPTQPHTTYLYPSNTYPLPKALPLDEIEKRFGKSIGPGSRTIKIVTGVRSMCIFDLGKKMLEIRLWPITVAKEQRIALLGENIVATSWQSSTRHLTRRHYGEVPSRYQSCEWLLHDHALLYDLSYMILYMHLIDVYIYIYIC